MPGAGLHESAHEFAHDLQVHRSFLPLCIENQRQRFPEASASRVPGIGAVHGASAFRMPGIAAMHGFVAPTRLAAAHVTTEQVLVKNRFGPPMIVETRIPLGDHVLEVINKLSLHVTL